MSTGYPPAREFFHEPMGGSIPRASGSRARPVSQPLTRPVTVDFWTPAPRDGLVQRPRAQLRGPTAAEFPIAAS